MKEDISKGEKQREKIKKKVFNICGQLRNGNINNKNSGRREKEKQEIFEAMNDKIKPLISEMKNGALLWLL